MTGDDPIFTPNNYKNKLFKNIISIIKNKILTCHPRHGRHHLTNLNKIIILNRNIVDIPLYEINKIKT